LTGGAARSGFHLGHRTTTDLDLFTRDADAWERGRAVMAEVGAQLALSRTIRQDAPGFRRYIVERGTEGLVANLVHERGAAAYGRVVEVDGIVMDSPEEIFVNKITSLVSRNEVRDLVDVMALEATGLDIAEHLDRAEQKDGGCTPATLAWLLDQLVIPEHDLPGGVMNRQALIDYRDSLVLWFRRLAHPGTT
jgi:hypothetical protein